MIKRKTILYIEDEPELAEIVKDEFSSHSINVIVSDSFNDAIRKLNNQKFNVILTDIKLKKGTGDQVIESIKADRKNKNYDTPIFVASGKITSNVLSSIRPHVHGAFVKPFNFDELVSKVKAIIDKQS